MILDPYNRSFKTLRVSLINTCNLACSYCVEGDSKNLSNEDVVLISSKGEDEYKGCSFEQLASLISRLNNILKFETIRLTGGEPTLYRDIVPLINAILPLEVPIKLTTNGYLLKSLLQKVDNKVFKSINISLDALNEDVFYQISRRKNLNKILDAIDYALIKKIEIRINCVVINGVNQNQIIPLLEYAGNRNIVIRFLELMKMGHYHKKNFESDFFSEFQILNIIKSKYKISKLPRRASSTANYWQTENGFTFGIIANETEPFCHDCNRLRLDSEGNIYGCLSNGHPISILKSQDLEHSLMLAMSQKQTVKFKGSTLSMLKIGG